MFTRLSSDIQCILDRDPAARSKWEVITCYPGLHAVVDEHPVRDARTRMDFDAGGPARNLRNEAAQPAQSVAPEPVRQPMGHQRMQARITRDHLPRAARGRIAVEDALDVGTQAIEHERHVAG